MTAAHPNPVTAAREVGGTPLVSIVIPCFIATDEQAALLHETLRTVDEQTCGDYEAIVVDDGSPHDVAGIAERHRRTRTIRQANAGPAVARNTGIAAARGANFVFLDADDLLLPPALEAGLRALGEHPECGFAIGRREEMTYEGEPVPWGIPAMPAQQELYEILLGFDWYIIPPSSAIFRRQVVEAVGGFRDPWGADDLDFYLRAARDFRAVCYEQPAVTRYRRYSASSSRDGERMLRSIRAVYERQRQLVQHDPAAMAAFDRGLTMLTGIFADCLVENVADRVRAGQWSRALRAARLLLRERGTRGAAQALRAVRGGLAPAIAASTAPA